MSVILIGTLDTKGVEYAFVRDIFAPAASRRSSSMSA